MCLRTCQSLCLVMAEADGCMVAAPPYGWWLLCDHVVSQTEHGVRGRVELGPSVPPSARLETRIKESMEPAGCLVRSTKPQGVVKATPARMVQTTRTTRTRSRPTTASFRVPRCCTGRRSRSPVDRVLSACKVHGTRKVVNYPILC